MIDSHASLDNQGPFPSAKLEEATSPVSVQAISSAPKVTLISEKTSGTPNISEDLTFNTEQKEVGGSKDSEVNSSWLVKNMHLFKPVHDVLSPKFL